jgi:hypothetical protein
MNKSFIFYHLFNEDGEGPMQLLKGEKLNPLCSLGICNLIASLMHHPNNPSSLDYTLN